MVNRSVIYGIIIALLVAGSLFMSVASRAPNGGAAVEAISSAMLWSGVVLGAFTLWSVFRSKRT